MKTKHAPKVYLGVAIALQSPQNGSAKNEELCLIWGPPETLRENVHCFGGFLQSIQQSGEMQAPFHVAWLQLEQLAIGS